MKKRNIILLVSLFSLSSLSFTSCDDNKYSDDDMFDDPSNNKVATDKFQLK